MFEQFRESEQSDCWRLLEVEYKNPYVNMALEEAIAIKVGEQRAPNTLRLWRNQNAVVLGRFQSATSELNLAACKRHKTKIVRRFTGGGAVYHDLGNLNYSVFFRKDHRPFKNDFLEIYKNVAHAVIEGLKILGASAKFEPPNSIQIGDYKISGLAAAIKGGAILCHGSLLVNSNLKILEEVLNVNNRYCESRYISSVRKKVTSLSVHLQRNFSVYEVKKALKVAFEDCFSIKLVPKGVMEEELILTHKLCKEKYSRKLSLRDP